MKLQFKRITTTLFSILMLVTVGTAIQSVSYAQTEKKENSEREEKESKKQSKLAKQAKITIDRAREIALEKVPNGKVESEELEKEDGLLVYSFDIRNEKGTITEVQVDAKTGEVVSVEIEDAAKEAAEKEKEAKEKSSKKPKP